MVARESKTLFKSWMEFAPLDHEYLCVCVLKYLVFFKKKVIRVREIGIHAYNKAYYHLHEAH